MNNNKVTVVVCCYSHKHFFEETVQSVLQQTYKSLEIVISNNGANKEYSGMIDQVAQKYGLKVIANHPNQYGMAMRGLVLPEITTEYLAVLHDDDVYFPNKLEATVAALEKDEADYVVSNYLYIDEHGKEISPKDQTVSISKLKATDTRARLLSDNFITPGCRLHFSTLVIKTELAKKILLGDPFYPRIADCFFWSTLLLDEDVKGLILESDLSKVRIHSANDRLYGKFDRYKRAKQFFLLSSSEIQLFSLVLRKASDPILIGFLTRYAKIKDKSSRLNALVDAAISCAKDPQRLWISRNQIVTMLIHHAFEIDPAKTVEIAKSKDIDLNQFMLNAYDRLADGYFSYSLLSYPWALRRLNEFVERPSHIFPFLWVRVKSLFSRFLIFRRKDPVKTEDEFNEDCC